MVVIRCTKKLLERVKPISVAPVDAAGNNLLGDWYATVLFVRPTWLVAAVSSRTLLPVIVPAAPVREVGRRLCDAAAEHLRRLEAPDSVLRAEMAAMASVVYAKTASRQVRGSLNDFCGMIEAYREHGPWMDLRAIEDRLAQAPCGPLQMRSPQHATRALLREEAEREQIRRALVEAAETAAGSGMGQDHPWGDTPESIAQWVHNDRQASLERDEALDALRERSASTSIPPRAPDHASDESEPGAR